MSWLAKAWPSIFLALFHILVLSPEIIGRWNHIWFTSCEQVWKSRPQLASPTVPRESQEGCSQRSLCVNFTVVHCRQNMKKKGKRICFLVCSLLLLFCCFFFWKSWRLNHRLHSVNNRFDFHQLPCEGTSSADAPFRGFTRTNSC